MTVNGRTGGYGLFKQAEFFLADIIEHFFPLPLRFQRLLRQLAEPLPLYLIDQLLFLEPVEFIF